MDTRHSDQNPGESLSPLPTPGYYPIHTLSQAIAWGRLKVAAVPHAQNLSQGG